MAEGKRSGDSVVWVKKKNFSPLERQLLARIGEGLADHYEMKGRLESAQNKIEENRQATKKLQEELQRTLESHQATLERLKESNVECKRLCTVIKQMEISQNQFQGEEKMRTANAVATEVDELCSSMELHLKDAVFCLEQSEPNLSVVQKRLNSTLALIKESQK